MLEEFDPGTYQVCQKTRDLEVCVRTIYLNDQSTPQEDYYVWAYEIAILNHGEETVQLLNRTWEIIDEHGVVQKVQGAGVVGKQPVLRPGDGFTYTSFTMLNTPRGSMFGSYEMETIHGEHFDIAIPEFQLQFPCRLVINNDTQVQPDSQT